MAPFPVDKHATNRQPAVGISDTSGGVGVIECGPHKRLRGCMQCPAHCVSLEQGRAETHYLGDGARTKPGWTHCSVQRSVLGCHSGFEILQDESMGTTTSLTMLPTNILTQAANYLKFVMRPLVKDLKNKHVAIEV